MPPALAELEVPLGLFCPPGVPQPAKDTQTPAIARGNIQARPVRMSKLLRAVPRTAIK
jgi:hypothetical protein